MCDAGLPVRDMGRGARNWDFYRGFSLLFSVTLLLVAVLAVATGSLAKRDPPARPLLASLFSRLPGIHDPLRCVFLLLAPRLFFRGGGICLALAFPPREIPDRFLSVCFRLPQ